MPTLQEGEALIRYAEMFMGLQGLIIDLVNGVVSHHLL
jgi:hypothetical protein